MKHQQNKMMINPQIERVLRQIILKDLSRGRKNFDKPHTEAVVYWMKYLLKVLGENKIKQSGIQPMLDPQVLITAAYAHDWGYFGLFSDLNSNSNSLTDIKKKKELHMLRGSEMIEQLLQQRLGKLFTQNQILRVSHLVLFHDKIRKLIDEDEILLMEADTLGMLNTNFVKSSFSKKDNDEFMNKGIKGLRLPRFMHNEAIKVALELIKKRNESTKNS